MRSLGLLVSIALAAAGANAQTLYKLIDRNGKVTYSESPPKDFDGKVVPLNIDPKANTATMPKGELAPRTDAADAERDRAQVRAARQKLEAAQKALAEAKASPAEGEIERVGKKGGGTRPVASEDYQKRLQKLEQDVKDAEDELRRVREGR